MFEEGGHSYPQHLFKDKAQRSEWLKKSKGKETVHCERKWLVGFCSWHHWEAISALISRDGCWKLKWAGYDAGISLMTFSRFLWILDLRAALGYVGMELCIPAHFPEFMLELCLVGCHSSMEGVYFGIVFLPKHYICSLFFHLLWFTELLILLLPEYEDVALTISCPLCDEFI